MSGTSLMSVFTFATVVMLSAPAFAATGAGNDTLAHRVHESLGSYYGSGVSVQTRGSTVYLSGHVGTEGDKKEAVALAEKVPGVGIVHESLESLSGNEG